MKQKNKKLSFDDYYTEIYPDNWKEVKEALLAAENQMIRACFDAPAAQTSEKILDFPKFSAELASLPHKRDKKNLKNYYVMDPASFICASQLNISPGDKVLDMCAAPGGKTLILAESLAGGELWSNEISPTRRDRLKQVIIDYVPKDIREHVFIKGKDGLKYGINFPEEFDKILLDAPCSSERHVLKDPKELESWGPKRTKKLAGIQYGLLCSALLACKSGGEIVYSTCSLSPLENDGVIEKLLSKKGDQVEVILNDVGFFEKTKFGNISLPHQFGIGPIYFCKLKKI